jgi:hypothetical protein
MRPRDVIGLTGRMTTSPRRSGDPRSGRSDRLVVIFLIVVTAGLALVALLPWIFTLLMVFVWGLGGSGSNK